jgi:hypothetical protein
MSSRDKPLVSGTNLKTKYKARASMTAKIPKVLEAPRREREGEGEGVRGRRREEEDLSQRWQLGRGRK